MVLPRDPRALRACYFDPLDRILEPFCQPCRLDHSYSCDNRSPQLATEALLCGGQVLECWDEDLPDPQFHLPIDCPFLLRRANDRLGFRYWQGPGPVNTYLEEGHIGRFIVLLQSFILPSFVFVLAPVRLIVTAGEIQFPRQSLPRAPRRYFWRLIILFMRTVIGIGVLCHSNGPR